MHALVKPCEGKARALVWSLALLVLCSVGAGCAYEVAGGERGGGREAAAASEQALYFTNGVAFWPNGVVPVCYSAERWKRNAAGNLWPEAIAVTQAVIDRANHVRELLESTYEAIPNGGVDFTGFTPCSDIAVGTSPRKLRIVLRDNDGSRFNFVFRHCAPGEHYSDSDGNGEAGDCVSASGYPPAGREATISTSWESSAGYDWDKTFLHEVGHALAFTHENKRMDKPDHCGTLGKNDPAGVLITRYDQASIMNFTYCPEAAGGLTAVDGLGVEIVYTANREHTLSGMKSPLELGDGTLLYRTDDALVPDWTARGAYPGAYEGGIVYWFRASSSGDDIFEDATFSYGAARLPQGTSEFYARFDDFRGRAHYTLEQRVTASTGRHTALLMTCL